MKTLDINITNAVSETEILKLQDKVWKIHNSVMNKTVDEKDWLGWIDLPNKINDPEIKKIKDVAKNLKIQKIETLVVIGIGGSYLGTKAGYEFIYGPYSTKKPDIELVFAGNSISSEQLVSLLKYVENKKFAINVISKSGTTLEPSIAFREFRKLLEAKVGIEMAQKLIIATTDAKKGILFELASAKGYETFVIPDNVGGRFSTLSPVGLFPFECAGINIDEMLLGAQEANKNANKENILENDAYTYAVSRHILSKKYQVEMFASYEPKMSFFAEWWKQLFAESEGKDGKGLLPTSAIFSTDLHSIGQMIQDGVKLLFETVLFVKNPIDDLTFKTGSEDPDKLSFLDGKTLHEVNKAAYQGTLEAHSKVGNIPNIVITFDSFNAYTLGYLFQFFERALTISAYLLGVNPFNQPGVEVYKASMFKILNKDKK
ncbi:glucose-6-phosphate isomerase [Mycoplasmopsis felifaucium]|uniref:glucose-6-phosphate isomerase n=1 Tax=Mycoplasmopsis felifaucium TaxID=35768 RepID=UPI000489364F|nr:glucose-6-phosphate isomerase [Mycoplasmopsis felifaucium]